VPAGRSADTLQKLPIVGQGANPLPFTQIQKPLAEVTNNRSIMTISSSSNPRCGFARIRSTEPRTEYLFQADVYGSETSFSADRLSGVLDGR
jgi:hypothetical protein